MDQLELLLKAYNFSTEVIVFFLKYLFVFEDLIRDLRESFEEILKDEALSEFFKNIDF